MSCQEVNIDVQTTEVTCLEIRSRDECTILQPQRVKTLELITRGPQGVKGNPGSDTTDIEVTAAEDIPAFSVVTATGYIADSINVGHFAKVVGITALDFATGFTAEVKVDSEITNVLWSWSPGDTIFLNGTSLSTTPPSTGFCQRVAVARNAQTIIVKLEIPVLL